ncbi:hypothetical protein Emed_004935 [Eimeria media]
MWGLERIDDASRLSGSQTLQLAQQTADTRRLQAMSERAQLVSAQQGNRQTFISRPEATATSAAAADVEAGAAVETRGGASERKGKHWQQQQQAAGRRQESTDHTRLRGNSAATSAAAAAAREGRGGGVREHTAQSCQLDECTSACLQLPDNE